MHDSISTPPVDRPRPRRRARSRAETHEIRDLLEANLAALHALTAWVRSLGETRALLYVALRELIVANENEGTRS